MASRVHDPSFHHFIAGGIAGGVGAIVTCPLEVAKTRLQASQNKQMLTSAQKGSFRFGTGMWKTILDIGRIEGVFGLWRGIGPALSGVLPARSIWFTTYQYSKKKIGERKIFNNESVIHFSSAIIAGFSVASTTSPIWLVKTRMQLQSVQQTSLKYKNSFDCIRRVYKEEGFRAFYKGLTASYIGISESSIQMVLYEYFRYSIQKRKNNDNNINTRDIKLHPIEQLSVGSGAKLIAAALTYPHEVIRTRLREQREGYTIKYTSFFQSLRLVAKEEGVSGLYGGMAPHLVRVVPNAAILFFVYEFIMERFRIL